MNIESIKKVIDDWDPIDLIETHCPPDEYDFETNKIFEESKFAKITPITLGEIIYKIFSNSFNKNIFTGSFDKNIFNKTVEECINVAGEIIQMSVGQRNTHLDKN